MEVIFFFFIYLSSFSKIALFSSFFFVCFYLSPLYIDSPPKRSPGKYELRELGVALC